MSLNRQGMENDSGTRDWKKMDAADQLIIRYALGQRREKLPKDLANQIDNPTWSAQDLVDALHERASRDPELARSFMQVLAHHPHSRLGPEALNGSLTGAKAGRAAVPVEVVSVPGEAEKAMLLKRQALAARIEEAFFPETESAEKIDLEEFIKLMQGVELAKSLRGLKGVERDLNQRLKLR
jgi:hypothetical protein